MSRGVQERALLSATQRGGASRRGCRGALGLLVMLVLAACGGGTTGDAQAPPAAAGLPELSGRVADGLTETDVASLQVTVKGREGLARTAEGRLLPVDGTDYRASLDRLQGPWMLGTAGGLYSVATEPGTANLTPLTTLLVAQLLGADPGTFFADLGVRGGFEAADETAVALAQRRVWRHLQREHAVELPITLGSVVTTRFERRAGDPMFDALASVMARLGGESGFRAAVQAIAQESARCRLERLTVIAAEADAAALPDEFCPYERLNRSDDEDPGLQVLGFTNRHGDVLDVRLREGALVQVDWETAEGGRYGCSGANCRGLVIADEAADATRILSFAALRLAGADGTRVFEGQLRSAPPGPSLPGLPCSSNRYYLIDASGLVEGHCAVADDFGLGAAGQSLPNGATRRRYLFDDGAGGPQLEVVVQGDEVRSALVYTVDPDTGAVRALFQCRDGNCPGIGLGSRSVDGSLGVDVTLQPIRFEQAVLPAVQPDGSLSATESTTVQADLIGWSVVDPNAPPLQPLACGSSGSSVSVQIVDEAALTVVCEPTDSLGFVLRSTVFDNAGNRVHSLAGLLTDGQGGAALANGLTLVVSPAGAVLSLAFEDFDGPRYQCLGTGCTGITLGDIAGDGSRTVRFAGTVVQELGTGGLPADRTARLDGGFLAPPP